MTKPTVRVGLLAGAALFLVPSPSFAQSANARCVTGRRVTDLSSLDLEALLNTRIITASRFSEQESDAPGLIF